MTLLRTMRHDAPGTARLTTHDRALITERLAGIGVGYERWAADQPLDAAAIPEEIMDAYRADIDRLCAAGRYLLVDVARIRKAGDDPQWPTKAAEARDRFREEHSHDEDEVRFFVEGRGCFYLHIDDEVHAVVCEPGDLLSVPAGTVHWFDMGADPCFTAIRFFQKEDGWIADFKPDSIASRFPTLDQLLAG